MSSLGLKKACAFGFAPRACACARSIILNLPVANKRLNQPLPNTLSSAAGNARVKLLLLWGLVVLDAGIEKAIEALCSLLCSGSVLLLLTLVNVADGFCCSTMP